jgi:hypothetical protein
MSQQLTFAAAMSENARLVESGAALHWLVSRGKNPSAEKWSSAPRYSIEELKSQHRDGANIGIRLGAPSQIGNLYLHLIDVDVRKVELAHEAWEFLYQAIPELKTMPRVISGSGGESRHVYFLTDQPFSKKKLAKSKGFTMVWSAEKQREVRKFDWEIDLMGTGSQAVIPPSIHPDTGLAYRWERHLDLDFPALMTIRSDVFEDLGLSSHSSSNDDMDDLEAILIASPINMTSDQIDAVLSDLPESWLDDRDDWYRVGMALHHQFEGTNEGFERWCDWARQGAKFDAKDSARVWISIKGKKNPIRMPTLIQAAQNHRFSKDFDLETDDFAPKTQSFDLSDLLNEPVPSAATADKTVEFDPEWQRLLARNEDGELKSNLPNVRLVVQNDIRVRGIVAFNEFTHEMVLRSEPKRASKKRDKSNPVINLEGGIWSVKDLVNGDPWSDTHDRSVRLLIEAPLSQGGYGIKISDRDLIAAIDLSSQDHTFHPIRQMLDQTTWDGKKRAETLFIDYLGADDTSYHRQTCLLFLLAAVTRVFEPGHKFDSVPIIEGAQGLGKSTFVRILGLDWATELNCDISDPQKVIESLQGSWIVEIGELSAMARHEVNEMKSFVTRLADKARLPYAKRATVLPRQCVFIGSTNDKEYLRDSTGNRRWWPIVCNREEEIDLPKLRREVLQVWAEVLVMYRAMRQAQPFGDLPLALRDKESRDEAVAMQESRRIEGVEEVLAGKIIAWLNTPISSADGFEDLDAPAVMRNETCIAQVWEECLGGRAGASIPQTESTKIGKAMTMLGWKRSISFVASRDLNKRYGKCRVYDRP